MEHLTEKHISEITTLIRAKGVEMEELLYDLVDHVCCMVEDKMEQGKNYASALDESMTSFGNKGIRHIQEETTFLLTKNILAMKKTMHIIGITATILLLVGSIFKVLHYPGAGVMYLGGGFLLSFIFLPLLATIRVKQKKGTLQTWTTILGIVSAFILINGIFFKVMHWPYANVLMKSGGAMLLFGYLPLSIYLAIKHKSVRESTLVSLILSIAGFSILFVLVNLGNSKVVNDAILNIQYTINEDVEAMSSSNNQLLATIPDSVKSDDFQKAQELSLRIDELTTQMNFAIAQSHHPKLTKEELDFILEKNLHAISSDKGDLNVLTQNGDLDELMQLVDQYKSTYKNITGADCQITLNKSNMNYYQQPKDANFPLGIVIHDLSLLNLQVQKTQHGLIHYFKGRVS